MPEGTTMPWVKACAPEEIASEISAPVNILVWPMGAGGGCDAQYLFANEILSHIEGHVLRHSKIYRDFNAEYARLQAERIAAFCEFVGDVASNSFPEKKHLVPMPKDELEAFRDRIASA